MDIKQEGLIKFWTWCGKSTYWTYEKGNDNYPRLDLINIYKYAIPKLQDKGYIVKLVACEQSGFVVEIDSVILMERIYDGKSDSPTEALYNAIMKVIDNENPPRISDAEYKETCQTYNKIMNEAESKKHNPRLFKGGR